MDQDQKLEEKNKWISHHNPNPNPNSNPNPNTSLINMHQPNTNTNSNRSADQIALELDDKMEEGESDIIIGSSSLDFPSNYSPSHNDSPTTRAKKTNAQKLNVRTFTKGIDFHFGDQFDMVDITGEEGQDKINQLIEEARDANGNIETDHLRGLITKFAKKSVQKREIKSLLWMAITAITVLVLIQSLFVWMIITLTQEVKVNDNNEMVASGSGGDRPLKVQNSEFVVDSSGNLVITDTDGNRRLEELAIDGSLASPSSASVVATRKAYKYHALSSTLPLKYYTEMEWMAVESESGSRVTLRIDGVTNIPRHGAKCGSILVITTQQGRIELDDTEISFDNNIGSIFSEAGLDVAWPNATDTSSRRRLNSDVSLTALFNTIGEEEWICESVESPELPNLYAANVTLITDCIDETGKDICTLVWGAGGPLVDVPGVVTAENGQRFLHKKRYLWQNGSDTVIMDYPSFSPFMITATIAMKGQGFMNFQFNQLNEHVTQCMESDLDLKLRLPDDYHFYYVETDPATDIRMFRISYEVESYNGEKIIEEDGTTIWSHIEYYDHKDTKMPVKLVFQDGKGTLVYDELVMEPALIPRYDDLAVTQIQQEEWDTCMMWSSMYTGNTLDEFRLSTERAFNNIESNPKNDTTTNFTYMLRDLYCARYCEYKENYNGTQLMLQLIVHQYPRRVPSPGLISKSDIEYWVRELQQSDNSTQALPNYAAYLTWYDDLITTDAQVRRALMLIEADESQATYANIDQYARVNNRARRLAAAGGFEFSISGDIFNMNLVVEIGYKKPTSIYSFSISGSMGPIWALNGDPGFEYGWQMAFTADGCGKFIFCVTGELSGQVTSQWTWYCPCSNAWVKRGYDRLGWPCNCYYKEGTAQGQVGGGISVDIKPSKLVGEILEGQSRTVKRSVESLFSSFMDQNLGFIYYQYNNEVDYEQKTKKGLVQYELEVKKRHLINARFNVKCPGPCQFALRGYADYRGAWCEECNFITPNGQKVQASKPERHELTVGFEYYEAHKLFWGDWKKLWSTAIYEEGSDWCYWDDV